VQEKQDGLENVYLIRKFPSALYEKEHIESKEHLPEKIEIHPEVLTDLSNGKYTPEIERLINQCVVLE
jgi:hypothetical protein